MMTSSQTGTRFSVTAVTLLAVAIAAGTCPTRVSAQPAEEESLALDKDFSLPKIPRYEKLPCRFFMRFEFQPIKRVIIFPESYLPLFVSTLQTDAYGDDLHLKAARALERVAKEKLAAPGAFVSALRDRMNKTSDRDVRRVCAMALVAADSVADAAALAKVCQPEDEILCERIEPWLIEHRSDVLLTDWKARITDWRTTSRSLLNLACTGVAALHQTSETEALTSLAADDRLSFSVRSAAARAVAVLAPDTAAFELADQLAKRDRLEQLIAVALLSTAKSDGALSLLEQLCDHSDVAVAAAAWNTMVQQDVDRLLARLDDAAGHREPNVRFAVLRCAELRPTEEHCDLLSRMTADEHIGLRNEARRTLQRVAQTDATLKARILANAGDVTADPDASWQQLEQAMLLLGVLRHDEFQDNLIARLAHDRPEVLVTAAWLLHLFPKKHLAEPAAQEAIRRWDEIRSSMTMTEKDVIARSLQIMFLCDMAARTKTTIIENLCMGQFSKAVPLTPETRAVALWCLGTLKTDSQDDELRKRFTERLFDNSPTNPEYDVVKAASAISLGLLGNRAAIPALRNAELDWEGNGEVGRAVATALKRFGEKFIPPVTEISVPDRGFLLLPGDYVDDRGLR